METLKDKIFLYTFNTALIIISIIPEAFQHLFVHPSGKFTGIGLTLAVIIVVAISKKWKYAKLLFNFTLIISIALELFIIYNAETQYLIVHVMFLTAMIILTLIFNLSKTVQKRFIVNAGFRSTTTKVI